MKQLISGGTHTHNYFPTQQQLNLETKETLGIRIEPSIKTILAERAAARGTTPSALGGKYLKRYLKLEPQLKNLLSLLETIME
jgi:hypothetical protein